MAGASASVSRWPCYLPSNVGAEVWYDLQIIPMIVDLLGITYWTFICELVLPAGCSCREQALGQDAPTSWIR